MQASKPSPVKTLPPAEAVAIRRGGVGSAEREARAAAARFDQDRPPAPDHRRPGSAGSRPGVPR